MQNIRIKTSELQKKSLRIYFTITTTQLLKTWIWENIRRRT